MHIKQFYDTGLAHASYAIMSNRQIVLVDPARNPAPYFDYANSQHAKILGVIETHPHADFVSSHLEFQQQYGATVYTSKLSGATYPHQTFDDGDEIKVGELTLKAINTPGHSPDSICVLIVEANGKEHALLTGDTLFVGDVGRPDLHENSGNLRAKAKALAAQLYQSLHEKLLTLPDYVLVYPTHGAGSLCGKNMSADRQSTIGRERSENYALQSMDEEAFVNLIVADQPYVPKYFSYNVSVNRMGADTYAASMERVPFISDDEVLDENTLIIDARNASLYRTGHLLKSINIPDGQKFETWIGSIVDPGESFYLLAESKEQLQHLLEKIAKIGYEKHLKGMLLTRGGSLSLPEFDLDDFKKQEDAFQIVDVRNESEVKDEGKIFKNAISLPLPRLRESIHLLPDDKPMVVHCAGGYRSAIATSIIANDHHRKAILDMGDAISNFHQ